MNRSRVSSFLLLAYCLCLSALAQQSQSPVPSANSSSTALPSDPAALLQLASQVNGLHGDDLQPWHIRATWEVFDDKEKLKHQGTWEEWWAGDQRYKIIVSSEGAQRTTYGTERGLFIVGTPTSEPDPADISGGSDTLPATYFAAIPSSLPAAEFLLQRLVTHPVPEITSTQLGHMRLEEADEADSGVQMKCVLEAFILPDGRPHVTADKDGKFLPSISRYCFDGKAPLVRIESAPGQVSTFNSLLRFQNRYLARSIRIVHTILRSNTFHDPTLSRTTRTYAPPEEAHIKLDTVELLTTLSAADFTPPANAIGVSDLTARATSQGLMAGEQIAGGLPAYPPEVRAWRIQGVVEASAIILQDGSLEDLTIVSGPRALRNTVLDDLKTWRYEPYLMGGQPVKVRTRIHITFSQ